MWIDTKETHNSGRCLSKRVCGQFGQDYLSLLCGNNDSTYTHTDRSFSLHLKQQRERTVWSFVSPSEVTQFLSLTQGVSALARALK